MYEHNALGYRSGLALCLTKVRSSRARCPATALIGYCNRTADDSISCSCLLDKAVKEIKEENIKQSFP